MVVLVCDFGVRLEGACQFIVLRGNCHSNLCFRAIGHPSNRGGIFLSIRKIRVVTNGGVSPDGSKWIEHGLFLF